MGGESAKYEWARRRTRGELLDLVLEIEDRMRRLVRTVLRDAAAASNTDWQDLVPTTIRDDIAKRGGREPVDVLDGATLKQLIDLVLHHWQLFEEQIGDRKDFTTKANAFREWRNDLAHGKRPDEKGKVRIASLIADVGRRVGPGVDAPEGGRWLNGASVLWVDDNPDGNHHERRILRMLGISVVPALSNDEALELLEDHAFDLVISDIDRGGGETGVALPAKLRRAGVDVPVLFYVGRVDETLGRPPGAHDIYDDAARLVRDTLALLTR